MAFRSPRPSGPPAHRLRFAGAVACAAVVLAGSACSQPGSIESADVPSWKATALPPADRIVLEDAGKILTRDPIVRAASGVQAGSYTLTMSCDGGGKAFFSVSLNGTRLAEAGAACNGSRETARIRVPDAGTVEISATSVDAPLIYGYHLAPAA